jgi:hypothetical protein
MGELHRQGRPVSEQEPEVIDAEIIDDEMPEAS